MKITNFIFNPKAIYEAFYKEFDWEAPKGSTGEKLGRKAQAVAKQLWKEAVELQKIDQQQGTKSGVTPQNKYSPN